MKERMEQRLEELRAEFEAGQTLLADLEARQSQVRSSLLRISGAVQVLEEMLNQESLLEQSVETSAAI